PAASACPYKLNGQAPLRGRWGKSRGKKQKEIQIKCREQLFGNSKTLFAQTGDLVSQCARAYTEFFSRILATAPLLTQGIHDDFVFPLLEIIAQLSAAWPRILGIGDHDVLR